MDFFFSRGKASLVGLVMFVLSLATGGCSATGPHRAGNSGNEEGLKATILIYSGRENPSFHLEEGAANELVELLSAAKENRNFEGTSVHPSILGYNGVLVENFSQVAGLPSSFAVYKENIEAREKGGTRFLLDPKGGVVEDLLLSQARRAEAISEKELRFIRGKD